MSGDLHCHSRFSDGSASPEDIITIAKMRGLSAISVTDHDTLAGNMRVKMLGESAGIEVIPGAEFSCYDYKRRRRVHILAYLYSYPERLEELCRKIADMRRKSAEQMISRVCELYPVTAEMILEQARESTNIYKQHIMHVLMNAGYTVSIFGDLYNELFNYETGSCSVKNEYPDVFEVINELKNAQAVIVLAHPSVYKSMELLPELIDAGIHGVEVWHPRNRAEDIGALFAIAKEHELITTGGSDYHGMYASRPTPLGACTAPDECIKALYECKNKSYQ